MSRTLKVGVIGLGFFGSRHARIYAEHPAAELVAVCDSDPGRVAAVAGETGARGFENFHALLALPGLDAVSICLPDRLHEDAAVAAAEAGKTILLEKPLAHEAAAADRIVAAVEENGARLMVGHILRFDPRYVQTFHAAAPELLGAPIHLRAKRNGIRSTARRLGAASSILFYMGVHDVDAMQWIARSRIARVYAQKIELLGTGNEDALYAVVNFENGAIGSIDYSWAWPDGLMNGFRSSLEIIGTRSAAYLDCTDQGFHVVEEGGTSGGDTHLWPEINGRIAGDLADELDHFVKASLSGRPYAQHYREALDAIPVLDALAQSARTGLPVDVAR
jgi:predicted dehydrogenase